MNANKLVKALYDLLEIERERIARRDARLERIRALKESRSGLKPAPRPSLDEIVYGKTTLRDDDPRFFAFDEYVHGLRTAICPSSEELRDLAYLSAQIGKRYKNRESIESICQSTAYRGMLVSPSWVRDQIA